LKEMPPSERESIKDSSSMKRSFFQSCKIDILCFNGLHSISEKRDSAIACPLFKLMLPCITFPAND